MNYTLQLHGERVLYPVPPGLSELMSDVAHEVLRAQPAQLYRFIADYLDTLLRVRAHARSAESLVSEVLAHNTELLALVGSLGASWDEVNAAAIRIQRTYRCYVARRELQKKLVTRQLKANALRASESSESFRNFLYTNCENFYNPDDASVASSLVLEAYDKFINQKEGVTDKPVKKDASVDTIDIIPVKTKRAHQPPKRDSKLLVYEQSPHQSIVSTWSLMAREQAIREAEQKKKANRDMLVYQQTPAPELPGSRYKMFLRTSSQSITSQFEGRHSLPMYYDETQPKIPMISESGKLEDENQDIVTLYSTDSVDDERKHRSESVVTLPSLSNVSRGKQLAQELYDVIDQRSGKASRVVSETSRVVSETSRVVSETSRVVSETSKVVSETSRVASVASKVVSENRSQGSRLEQKVVQGSNASLEKTSQASGGPPSVVALAEQGSKISELQSKVDSKTSKLSIRGSVPKGSETSTLKGSRRSKTMEENQPIPSTSQPTSRHSRDLE